jgi:hypothetical protein
MNEKSRVGGVVSESFIQLKVTALASRSKYETLTWKLETLPCIVDELLVIIARQHSDFFRGQTGQRLTHQPIPGQHPIFG